MKIGLLVLLAAVLSACTTTQPAPLAPTCSAGKYYDAEAGVCRRERSQLFGWKVWR